MKFSRIALGLTALALMAMVISTTNACPPGLSPGYWKHNVKVYCGGPGSYSGDPKETAASMEYYESIIAGWVPGFTLEWANERFQNNEYKSMWLTIANWFNAAAHRLPYSD